LKRARRHLSESVQILRSREKLTAPAVNRASPNDIHEGGEHAAKVALSSHRSGGAVDDEPVPNFDNYLPE
jgi:hypothetical protein